mgnify:FL=1
MDKAVLYRIYVADNTGEDWVDPEPIVQRYFQGATFLYCYGLYKGISESSVIIEIIAGDEDLQNVVHLAGDLKVLGKQESVLVTRQSVEKMEI